MLRLKASFWPVGKSNQDDQRGEITAVKCCQLLFTALPLPPPLTELVPVSRVLVKFIKNIGLPDFRFLMLDHVQPVKNVLRTCRTMARLV